MYVYDFSFYFTPLTGVLFNFPSRYWCTIGLGVVFSLRPWSAWIPTGFPVSRSTWDTSRVRSRFRVRGYHSLWRDFPDASATHPQSHIEVPQPHFFPLREKNGLDCSRFVRHYSGNLGDFFSSGYLDVSLPPVSLPCDYVFIAGIARYNPCWVAPFGIPRIKACLRLPEAYRCLPRPSSPHPT